jgi:nucleoside-diphosphate-sugar epimerase
VDNLLSDAYSPKVRLRNWSQLEKDTGKKVDLQIKDLAKVNVGDLISECSHVVNLAGIAGQYQSWTGGESYWRNNVIALQNVLESVSVSKNRKFIQASSSSVYGNISNQGDLQSFNPISPYGVTKLAAEKLINSFCHSERFETPVCILRFFSVFGPNQRPDMGIHRFIENMLNDEKLVIYGNGEATRTFTFVEDICSAIWKSIENPNAKGDYDISGIETFSINQLIENLGLIIGKEPKIEFQNSRIGDQISTIGNTEKANREFGFSPSVSFLDGLNRQVEWHQRLQRE